MKKIISVLLCVVILLGAVSTLTFAADSTSTTTPIVDGVVNEGEYNSTTGALACAKQDIANNLYIIKESTAVEARTAEYLINSDASYIYIAYCGYGEMFSDLYFYLNPKIASGARDTVRLYLRAGWRDKGIMDSSVQVYTADEQYTDGKWSDYVTDCAIGTFDDGKLNKNTIEIRIKRSALSDDDYEQLGISILSRPEQSHTPDGGYGEWQWGAAPTSSVLPYRDEFGYTKAGYHTFTLSDTPTTSVDTEDTEDENSPWVAERKTPLEDYDFSIAVIGDTQVVTWHHTNPDDPQDNVLEHTYDWIIENKDEKKIAFSIGLGDITEYDLDVEWEHATEEIFKLDGVLPYAINQGNHDSVAQFNKYFANSVYTKQIDGQMTEGAVENTYMEFTAGGIKYLSLNLDYGPSDEVLAWANEIVEAHPNHRVIVSTHAYLFSTGKPQTQNEGTVPTKDAEKMSGGPTANNGIDIWNEFISQHENIFLVLSGHEPSEKLVTAQSRGANGNIVTQMLIDPQHIDKDDRPTGMIAMLYFSDDGNTMQVEWYSPYQDMYYLTENQFTVDLHIDDVIEITEIPNDPYYLDDFGQTHYYTGSVTTSPIADGKIGESEYAIEIKDIKVQNDLNDDRIYYQNNSNTTTDIENINLYVSQDENFIYLAAEVTDNKCNNYSDSVNFYIGTGDKINDLNAFYIPRTPTGGVECWPVGWETTFNDTENLAIQAGRAAEQYVEMKATSDVDGTVTYELVLKRDALSAENFEKMFFGVKITTSDSTPRALDALYFGFDASPISFKYPTYITKRDSFPVHPYVIVFGEEVSEDTETPETDEPETNIIDTSTSNTDIPVTDDTAAPADRGCGASVSAIGVILITAFGASISFISKRKE